MTFCLSCGLPLGKDLRKWNKRFKGQERKSRKFCNDVCAKAFDRKRRESK